MQYWPGCVGAASGLLATLPPDPFRLPGAPQMILCGVASAFSNCEQARWHLRCPRSRSGSRLRHQCDRNPTGLTPRGYAQTFLPRASSLTGKARYLQTRRITIRRSYSTPPSGAKLINFSIASASRGSARWGVPTRPPHIAPPSRLSIICRRNVERSSVGSVCLRCSNV